MAPSLQQLKAAIERHYPGLFRRLTGLRDRLAPYYAEPELRLVPWLCPAGETVLDIGANSGIYTFWMLRAAARVVAFEPNPALAAVLRAKFPQAVSQGRLQIVAAAVSDAEGEITLYVPQASALASVEAGAVGGHGQAVVPVAVSRITLDRFERQAGWGQVGFLKIDVEGHEGAVVSGALALISRCRPNILVESEERHHPGALAGIAARLEPLGYQGFFVQQGRLLPLTAFDPARLQRRDALNATGTHRRKGQVYINNFLFIAREGVADRLRRQLQG